MASLDRQGKSSASRRAIERLAKIAETAATILGWCWAPSCKLLQSLLYATAFVAYNYLGERAKARNVAVSALAGLALGPLLKRLDYVGRHAKNRLARRVFYAFRSNVLGNGLGGLNQGSSAYADLR